MQTVRLDVDVKGVIWVTSTCKACGAVTTHLAADAIVASIPCSGCGRQMDMKGATIEAVAAARESQPILRKGT